MSLIKRKPKQVKRRPRGTSAIEASIFSDSCIVEVDGHATYVSPMKKRELEQQYRSKKQRSSHKRNQTRNNNKQQAAPVKFAEQVEPILGHLKFMPTDAVRKTIFAIMEKCYGKFEFKVKRSGKWLSVGADDYLAWEGRKIIGQTRTFRGEQKKVNEWMRKIFGRVEQLEDSQLKRYVTNLYFQKNGLYVR